MVYYRLAPASRQDKTELHSVNDDADKWLTSDNNWYAMHSDNIKLSLSKCEKMLSICMSRLHFTKTLIWHIN